MKKIVIAVMLMFWAFYSDAQNAIDTNLVIKIAGINWSPDGEQLFLTLLKLDKRKRSMIDSKSFSYDIKSKKLELLPIDGRDAILSSNGNMLVYLKPKGGNKADIYLYNLKSKEE